jgi:hypothetical protein
MLMPAAELNPEAVAALTAMTDTLAGVYYVYDLITLLILCAVCGVKR